MLIEIAVYAVAAIIMVICLIGYFGRYELHEVLPRVKQDIQRQPYTSVLVVIMIILIATINVFFPIIH